MSLNLPLRLTSCWAVQSARRLVNLENIRKANKGNVGQTRLSALCVTPAASFRSSSSGAEQKPHSTAAGKSTAFWVNTLACLCCNVSIVHRHPKIWPLISESTAAQCCSLKIHILSLFIAVCFLFWEGRKKCHASWVKVQWDYENKNLVLRAKF